MRWERASRTKVSAIFVIYQVEKASELTLAVSPKLHGDNSGVGVSTNTLAKLRLSEGDYVLARSDSFTTALRVSVGDHPDGNASLSREAQNSLSDQSGSIATEPSPELAPVSIQLPSEPAIQSVTKPFLRLTELLSFHLLTHWRAIEVTCLLILLNLIFWRARINNAP